MNICVSNSRIGGRGCEARRSSLTGGFAPADQAVHEISKCVAVEGPILAPPLLGAGLLDDPGVSPPFALPEGRRHSTRLLDEIDLLEASHHHVDPRIEAVSLGLR
jgi:hypothetical protein